MIIKVVSNCLASFCLSLFVYSDCRSVMSFRRRRLLRFPQHHRVMSVVEHVTLVDPVSIPHLYDVTSKEIIYYVFM